MADTRPAQVERWSAFTDDPDGGNPAGVVVLEAWPSDGEMQAVAAEVGYSETAFLVPAGAAGRWDVRYFAPASEVPFCGHATIASAVALAARDDELSEAVFATPAGDVTLDVTRGERGTLATLTAPAAAVAPIADADLDALLACFGWDRGVLDPTLPPAVAFAGAHHPVLAVRTRIDLGRMSYAFDELRRLMERSDWTTIQVVHREDERTFHARDPFPVGGVVEDPATGAAAAALGTYLRDRGALPSDGRFVVHQGEDMGRPSVLHVDASGDANVRVTGTAVPIP